MVKKNQLPMLPRPTRTDGDRYVVVSWTESDGPMARSMMPPRDRRGGAKCTC